MARYGQARDFLARIRRQLERNEAANNLMLGIAGRLYEDDAAYGDLSPYLAVVGDEKACHGELAAIAIMMPPHRSRR